MSSEKPTPNDRDDTRQVSDELLRKASEGPVRHLPDALFGGPAPARPGDEPAGTRATGAERDGAVSDELLRKASEGPVRHLPDLLFGGPVPEPAAQEGNSGAGEGGQSGPGAVPGDSVGDTGPPGVSVRSESTVVADDSGDPVPHAESAIADGPVAANSAADQEVSSGGSSDAGAATMDRAAASSDAEGVDSASAVSTNIVVAEGNSAIVAESSEAGSAASGEVVQLEPPVAESEAVSGEHGSAAGVEVTADDAVPAGAEDRSVAGDGMGGSGRPVLLVIADSLAYFGPKGGLPADDPRIWPNLVASELDWDVELIGRIGWTCRDAYWALIGDPRVWAAVPRAGAVVFATGGMDSLPSPLPTALRELIRYVRPPSVRRRVRDGYNWLQPRLSKLGRPVALPPHVSIDYLEQSRISLAQLRPELPMVGVLPSVHDCEAYGRVHTGREPAVRALREWSAKTAVPLVDLGEAVRDNVFHGESNPDGIHWGWEGHTAVARAMVKVISEVSC